MRRGGRGNCLVCKINLKNGIYIKINFKKEIKSQSKEKL